ncbi:FtsL-like putative cell division protein [Mucilaginibacter aquariorum]|uniref:FtsL-like putative cell division protein n=1 Tax=Mucilaginibacter aquariorum TaxID=2967225 RepID=A0ABT1T8D7_9SPHI|nr:FtsL-like putative cell division protein [Mucilaginibacter aquariorum]MCQ6960867.1 FtsL-like putative cell division protein [Mucilaginibacter aquariorum]
MTNRLRTEIPEEELEEQKLVVEEKPVKEIPDNFFTQFLKNGVITTDDATHALPFILYVAFLGMLYIGNRHLSENNIRDIDKIGKEVKELSWEYKSSKADLAFKSTLTEVAKRADTLGIKESNQPPQKITVKEDVQE